MKAVQHGIRLAILIGLLLLPSGWSPSLAGCSASAKAVIPATELFSDQQKDPTDEKLPSLPVVGNPPLAQMAGESESVSPQRHMSGRELLPSGAVSASGFWQWEEVTLPQGIEANEVLDLAPNPNDAYIAFLGTNSGLYQTADAGLTWARVATATLPTWIPEITFAPSNSQRVYASSWELFRSDDGGQNWVAIDSPPSACGLTVAPTDEDRVYARSCRSETPQPAIYRTDNAGQTWISPAPTFTNTLDALSISPANPNLLVSSDFDEIFVSRDGGATWQKPLLGTRYRAYPVFDPEPPYSLYVGHWSGLLRSLDGAQTWQDSDVSTEISTLIASPLNRDEVLGGAGSDFWRLTSSDSVWHKADWDTPPPLSWLRRSWTDGRVIYAKSDGGLWRYAFREVDLDHQVFLPLIGQAWPQEEYPEPARLALERINEYRAWIPAYPFRMHPAIVDAAQNHADYHMLNHDDPSAWTNGAHGEVEGKPGYTGTWPLERMRAAGYPDWPWWGGAEVMHYHGDPIAAVDDWIGSVYHRLAALGAESGGYAGYGYGKSEETAVDVMDFGSGPAPAGWWTTATPYPLGYPSDGQTGVPVHMYLYENPNPLPPSAPQPVGYPFTLSGVRGLLNVTWAEMRDEEGQLVPVHPNPPDCSTSNCYALIAVAPLQPNTWYTVSAEGTVEGVEFSQTWCFMTGSGSALDLKDQGPEKRIGPPWYQR